MHGYNNGIDINDDNDKYGLIREGNSSISRNSYLSSS